MDKYESFSTPPTILRWLYSFLQGRTQAVKIGNTISRPLSINGAVPQGAILGLEFFITMIDDMKAQHPVLKYVDDSSPFEIIRQNKTSTLQQSIDTIQEWSKRNDMRLNGKKTHEMTICFKRNAPKFDPIKVGEAPVTSVTSAKLVGVTIQNDLKWDEHTDAILKKAQKRLYFLKRLRKAGAREKDLLRFYSGVIRPVCEYAAPAWATSLTQTQRDKLENIQKRAFNIISPGLSYEESLLYLEQSTLEQRRLNICESFFRKIQNPTDKIHDILPEQRQIKYNFRQSGKFKIAKCRTKRYKSSFLPFALQNF